MPHPRYRPREDEPQRPPPSALRALVERCIEDASRANVEALRDAVTALVAERRASGLAPHRMLAAVRDAAGDLPRRLAEDVDVWAIEAYFEEHAPLPAPEPRDPEPREEGPAAP